MQKPEKPDTSTFHKTLQKFLSRAYFRPFWPENLRKSDNLSKQFWKKFLQNWKTIKQTNRKTGGRFFLGPSKRNEKQENILTGSSAAFSKMWSTLKNKDADQLRKIKFLLIWKAKMCLSFSIIFNINYLNQLILNLTQGCLK